MQQFNCPFCGPRDQSEFTYGREKAAMPALDAGAEAWQRYVYERDNPCGPHAELWQHNHGCRQWLEILRDTLTHEVIEVRAAREAGVVAEAQAAVREAAAVSEAGATRETPAAQAPEPTP